MGLGVKLSSFSQKKKKTVCEQEKKKKLIEIFFGKKSWREAHATKWRPEKKKTGKKKLFLFFQKKHFYKKNRFENHLAWHHVTSWCAYACREVKNKTDKTNLRFFHKRDIMWCHSRWHMRTKEFWMLSRVKSHSSCHYPSDAMTMPWNVIKVTLHSSWHYPSDAMSMPWECYQGDITF